MLGKKYCSCGGFQNYLIFHPLLNTLKLWNPDGSKVIYWKSVGVSTEKIEPVDISVAVKYPKKDYINRKFNNAI